MQNFSYQSIAVQAAENIRREINTMAAGEKLPSERELTNRMQISRKTVRKALAILRSEGLIVTHGSRATEVAVSGTQKLGSRQMQVHLLLPDALEQARPFTALWVNQVSALLNEGGYRFKIITGQKYYGQRVGRSLENLVKTQPADCWILAHSNEPLQRWFSDKKQPAVIAGSAFENIALPSVDVDHIALGRHAAAQFLRNGHTRTALFVSQEGHAGDIDTISGFTEAMQQPRAAAAPIISRVTRSPESVIRELGRLLALRSSPTGFLLSNSFYYLTAQSYLASLSLRIPQDISLISQDEGPFLSHLYPTPTRYQMNPKKYATALSRTVRRVLEKDVESSFKIRIMPDFLSCGSVAKAAPRREDALQKA